MSAERLQDAVGLVREEYIQAAHAAPEDRRGGSRIAMWIALAAAALLLTGGALAHSMGWFGLAHMELTELSGGADVSVPTGMISLQGYAGSPEYQAVQEWNGFLAGVHGDDMELSDPYDSDPSGFSAFAGGQYPVYSQAMVDEVMRITEKYGLTLYREMNVVSHEELIRRVGGEFLGAAHGKTCGYIYDNGTFQMDGSAVVTGLDRLDYQLRRAVKGTFDPVMLNVQDTGHYEQWQHTAPGGQTVLLALGPSKALVIGDFQQCFVTLNVLEGTQTKRLTREGLEELADGIDYGVLAAVVRPELSGD